MSDLRSQLVDLGDGVMLAEICDIVGSDAGLEALARGYDAEDSAQRGERDPWDAGLVEQFIAENGEQAWDEWRSERLACARAALKAVGLA